jgi:hypothetical protein
MEIREIFHDVGQVVVSGLESRGWAKLDGVVESPGRSLQVKPPIRERTIVSENAIDDLGEVW